MSVRNVLEKMLEGSSSGAAEVQEARRWLARTEVLLDWIARHPRLVEVNGEAGHLLSLFRGEPGPAANVDYRGIGKRAKQSAGAGS